MAKTGSKLERKKRKKETKEEKEMLERRFREKKSKVSFFDKIKLRRNPDKTFFITIMFNNGTLKTFVLKTKKETFTYKKKTYYIDYEESWFNITQNHYQLYFHEGSPVPINREITKTGDERFFSVTPSNLKPIIRMEYIKTLAQSQELSKYLKISMLISGIGVFMTMVLAYFIYNLSKNLGYAVF